MWTHARTCVGWGSSAVTGGSHIVQCLRWGQACLTLLPPREAKPSQGPQTLRFSTGPLCLRFFLVSVFTRDGGAQVLNNTHVPQISSQVKTEKQGLGGRYTMHTHSHTDTLVCTTHNRHTLHTHHPHIQTQHTRAHRTHAHTHACLNY